jgi:glycosyltransferase involved in cell wall biosynthesis
MPPTSIAFVWTEINGYAYSCFRHLRESSTFSARLWAGKRGTTESFNFIDDPSQTDDHIRIVPNTEHSTVHDLIEEIRELHPEVIFLGGWHQPWCKAIIQCRKLAGAKIVLMFDNPWRGDMRQRLAPIALRAFVNRCSAAFVPGERSRTFARYIGFPEGRIFSGLYSVDSMLLNHAAKVRATDPWPKRFVFVGQLIERKGVDVLCEGYERYRKTSRHAWTLSLAGDGPLQRMAEKTPGIEVLGFLQPDSLANLLANSGCFLLPSRYDAWGLAIIEACISGLPIISTARCGATVETVRDWYNGRIIESGNPYAISSALSWAEAQYNLLPTFGARSSQLAAPYTADEWTKRVEQIVELVLY